MSEHTSGESEQVFLESRSLELGRPFRKKDKNMLIDLCTKHGRWNQSRSQLSKAGRQPGQMGVAATDKCKEGAY